MLIRGCALFPRVNFPFITTSADGLLHLRYTNVHNPHQDQDDHHEDEEGFRHLTVLRQETFGDPLGE